MSEATLKTCKLFIVPGENSNAIGNNLSKVATTNIHNAVQSGLHYLGICAGGFFGGYAIEKGLNLTSGVWFKVYDNYDKGTGSTAVEISSPTAPSLISSGTTAQGLPDGAA
jgi:Biotin-protein ligase, N terminal